MLTQDEISSIKARNTFCKCEFYEGMTLKDLKAMKGCQPNWVCSALDNTRRRFGH